MMHASKRSTARFGSSFRGRLVVSVVLLGCSSDDSTGPTPIGPINVTWDATAESYAGQNNLRVTYVCPANGTPGVVWGTDVYTDDSSVCTAAVHAGRITLAAGGSVTFEMRPGRSSYTGSTRNGITTSDWDDWDASFVFP